MSIRALLVEDDLLVAQLLRDTLAREGVKATHCTTLDCARRNLDQTPFELALVDRMLGGDDGLDFVAYARKNRPSIGIIIISGKNLPLDKISGLETGADDYVTKPLEPLEVAIRARRLASRVGATPNATSNEVLKFSNFSLDPVLRTLRHNTFGPVALTSREFDVLHCLVRSGNLPLSRHDILRLIHERDHHTTDRVIDTLIANIRRKLRQTPGGDPILTIRGKGYALGAVITRKLRNGGSHSGD